MGRFGARGAVIGGASIGGIFHLGFRVYEIVRESRGTHHKQTRRSGHAKDSARTLYGWLHEEGGLRYLWALWVLPASP